MLCLTREQYRRELLTALFAKIGTLTTSAEIVTICGRRIHKIQMKNYVGKKKLRCRYALAVLNVSSSG